MHERFLAAGVAVAGVDVGEAYGSPRSHAAFEVLYAEGFFRSQEVVDFVIERARAGATGPPKR
jgi:hypothetical protein